MCGSDSFDMDESINKRLLKMDFCSSIIETVHVDLASINGMVLCNLILLDRLINVDFHFLLIIIMILKG